MQRKFIILYAYIVNNYWHHLLYVVATISTPMKYIYHINANIEHSNIHKCINEHKFLKKAKRILICVSDWLRS